MTTVLHVYFKTETILIPCNNMLKYKGYVSETFDTGTFEVMHTHRENFISSIRRLNHDYVFMDVWEEYNLIVSDLFSGYITHHRPNKQQTNKLARGKPVAFRALTMGTTTLWFFTSHARLTVSLFEQTRCCLSPLLFMLLAKPPWREALANFGAI